jgi:hypothetical protein
VRELNLPAHGLVILPLESTLSPLPDGNRLYRDGDHYRSYREIARFRRETLISMRITAEVCTSGQSGQIYLRIVPPDPSSLNPHDLGSLARLASISLVAG